jgi:hypothetical protein
MKAQRRVFGRVYTPCPVTGKPVRIELTRTGLRVRTKHCRQVNQLSLGELVSLARGQGVFRL